MRPLHLLCLSIVSAAAALGQAPTITAVENAATNIVPGLPNSAIAQGALFVVKGANLGPASLAIATSFPLSLSIGGTSVQVTVGGATVDAIMYYSLAAQIAAILPSKTPTGTGTVKVTYNGQSASAAITVVANNIGVFTLSTTGAGDAVVTLPATNTVVLPNNAPNPGETVTLWATGLGPVTPDETQPAVQTDMPNIPLQVFIGGKPATILFRGRNACCSAVDTIYVTVPQGVATGCVVSVIIQINNLVSNATTMPVAASGRTCTPTNPAFSQSDFQRLLAKGGPLSVGGVSLSRTITTTAGIGPLPGMTTRSDSGSARFVKYTNAASLVLDTAIDVLTYGSCSVITFSGMTPDPLASLTPQYLDAGASLGVSGPNGNQTLNKTGTQGGILYSAKFDSTATYLSAGQYTITGPGGPDVGSFTAKLNVPAPLTWTNQSAVSPVNRATGVTVNWTGGDPGGYVFINGFSFVGTSASNAIGAGFVCTARTGDGTFTVPPAVLLALPASGTISGFAIPGFLGVYGNSTPVQFQATGLDLAYATNTVINLTSVTYQ